MKVFAKLLVVTIALAVFPTQAAEEGGLRLLSFSTLLGEMLTFVALVYVMVKFVWPPLMNAIETRQKEIADGLAAGEQGQQELADAVKEKSLLLEEARIKANEMVEHGEKRKNAIIDEAKWKAETERERILGQGRREVESERLAMQRELEQKLGDLVITGVSYILQREVNDITHRDIIGSLNQISDDTSNDDTPTIGRRGGKRGNKTEKKNRSILHQRRDTDIICLELPSHNHKWGIAIEKSKIIKCVHQGDEIEERDGIYIIPKMEDVEIVYTDEEHARVISLEKNTPLIFQTKKDWRGRGRKVKTISPYYHYVVFTPTCCGERKNQSPPITAENTVYDGYKAHFFAPDKDVAEDGFEHCAGIISTQVQFTLEGDLIPDSHSAGDLFSAPPQLNDTDNFRNVSRVDIGDEGKNKWHERFNPSEEQISDVLKNRGGWFYVRVYDKQSTLIFSIDFRLLPGLKGITINEKRDWRDFFMLPSDNGYPSAYVKFIGDDDITVYSKNIHIPEPERNNHAFLIPSRFELDKTEWVLKNQRGHEVSIGIILPRIWWRWYIGDDREDWQSVPMQIKREDIYYPPTERKGVEISLPLFVKKIHVGLDEVSRKPFNPTITNERNGYKRLSKLSLSEFSYHRDLKDPINEDAFLYVWTDLETQLFPILRIPSDTPPVPVPPTLVSTPPSKNKGYSKLELINAEICYTPDIFIRVDKRRQSCYEANVQNLRRIYNARQK